MQNNSVFVPVPLHSSKFRKRGYNQSALLAKGLAKKFAIPIIDCLEKNKSTKSQVGLSKEDRKENIMDAFALEIGNNDLLKQYKHIILVDDVVTSGATLREAAKVLKKAGCKYVWGVTLAHGE